MKQNSCLYRAVKKVVSFQFGINDLESDVFDRYNFGEGVPTSICVTVINQALEKYGIKVEAVYGDITDPELMDHSELIRRGVGFVPSPCIAHEPFHVEGLVGNERFSGDMSITLTRM